jgi:hypothetical protein
MFVPARCPYLSCGFHQHPIAGFFIRFGSYHPHCRPRAVPRFRCRGCFRTFSRQSFRADFRQRKPYLNATFLRLMVHCVGLRQAAKVLQVARRTVEHRFAWLAHLAAHFHRNRLHGATLHGPFQLDELETFEANRFQPVTVPVLIERHTMFLVATAVGPLRRKGRMTALQRRRRADHEQRFGRRPSQSAPAVRTVLALLAPLVPPGADCVLESDQKPLYGSLGRDLLKHRFLWRPHSASARRDRGNPLFPINHTNARLRHFLARLRRRTWCVSKKRRALAQHLSIATLWVNYCRGITNRTNTTPAEALNVAPRRYRAEEVLAWRQDWGSLSPALP